MSATLAPGEDGVAILTTVTAAAGEDRMAAAIGAMGATLGPEEEGMATLTTVTAAAGLPTTKEVAHRPHPVAPRDMEGGVFHRFCLRHS